MNNKDLYNEVYTKHTAYNHNVEYKYAEVSKFFNKLRKNKPDLKILDAGCGEGWNIKKLQEESFEVFGIEISDVCCDKFLKDLPHKCSDIISHEKEGNKYDAILCFDVLEHISKGEIRKNIESLASMAPDALLGCANHRDFQFGHELHLIQENEEWWENLLKEYYNKVKFVNNLGGNFYLFECKNESI